MIDGLGLVYEKQGNTGAAAYNQPYQDNTLHHLADQVNNERLYLRQKKDQQEKERAAANQKFLLFNPETWELETRAHFQRGINAINNEGARLHSAGYDLNDLTNPEVRKYREAMMNLETAAKSSTQQKKEYFDALKMIDQDTLSDKPALEADATKKALWEQYANPENNDPFSRMGKRPSDLFVYKEKPYDLYAPIKDLKIDDFVGKYGNDSPTGGAKGTTLNQKNLRQTVEAIANNPLNKEHYENGLSKGYWDNKQEYADILYQKKKLDFTPDYETVVKAPKGDTLADLENGNSEDLMNKLGTGQQTVSVPIYSVDEKPTSQKANVNLRNVIQLDNVESEVGWSSAINAKNGLPFTDKTGSFRLKSGAMALPLVQRGTNRILSPADGAYRFKDKNGKEQVLKGTAEQISQQLIKLGYAEYKPMIFGKAISKDAGGTSTEQDVWLPADAALHGTNDKNKALSTGEYAYEVYKRRANDLNAGNAGSNTNIGKVVSGAQIKSLVGTKGYEGYTEQELIDYYKGLGYTIQ